MGITNIIFSVAPQNNKVINPGFAQYKYIKIYLTKVNNGGNE
ncbi:hypothetical protein TUM17574_56940 [Klebsiella pneumoniae]|nr:hypothetical protein TUM17555_56440 [Klebsiella pneumoniae]GJK83602.1 hypothetical protein TUM17566_56540 [Klebsiella pneumoniae]GJL27318.1 hypothetical protein TUM17574_56940 [Klebsiella pneumoniae]GJL43862.1 hypothetical protein TUM17577_50710 [Enterobacter asburiae]